MLLYATDDGLFTKCPDCNAAIYVPTTISTSELLDRLHEGELHGDTVIDGHKLHETILSHVEINPDIHPTFTKAKIGSYHRVPCRHVRCMITRGTLTVLIGLWKVLGEFIDRWVSRYKK